LIEKVELTFAKVIWTYTPQKANGDRGDTDVIEGWDFETNQEHR
jgi:type VI protein secretion system component Hcp